MKNKLHTYLINLEGEKTISEIAKDLDTKPDTILDITNEQSKVFVDISRNNFPYVMKSDDETLILEFFQREDVDLCFLCMTKITDIKKHMKKNKTMGFNWLVEKWEQYRGY